MKLLTMLTAIAFGSFAILFGRMTNNYILLITPVGLILAGVFHFISEGSPFVKDTWKWTWGRKQ